MAKKTKLKVRFHQAREGYEVHWRKQGKFIPEGWSLAKLSDYGGEGPGQVSYGSLVLIEKPEAKKKSSAKKTEKKVV